MISTCLRARGRPQPHLNLQLLRSRYKSTNTPIRKNPIGIQLLPQEMHDALFLGDPPKLPSPDLLKLSKGHLKRHKLLSNPPHTTPPIHVPLPPLVGNSLDEHFYMLGMEAASPYLRFAREFAAVETPPPPKEWVHRAGWTKYYPDGRTEVVVAPEEEYLVFDTEVLYKISPFAVMATAVSPHAWYAWLSPWVMGETEDDRHLIPLGDPGKARIAAGHNIGFDRVRVKEEYNVAGTQTMFLDTMSLHIAANGATGKQKKGLTKKNGEGSQRNEEGFVVGESLEGGGHWSGQTSLNSLKDVAMFHCGIEVDKTVRDQFGTLDPAGVREQLDGLLTYCAQDVVVTHKVYKEVLPAFLEVCPHPVSFAALRHLSSCILPVNHGWESYIKNAEATYHKISDAVLQRLIDLAEEAVRLRKSPEIYNADPWLRQLDWSGQEVKQIKAKLPDDSPRTIPRKKPGMPKWYRDLFATADAPISLSVRGRISPLLLKMSWGGHPLFWSDEHGWCFRVSKRQREGQGKNSIAQAIEKYGKSFTRVDPAEIVLTEDPEEVYFKLPHKNGRCVTPLAKTYQQYFDSGILSSEYTLAKEALDMNAQCAYWISSRERIMEQTVVWQGDSGVDFGIPTVEGSQKVGIILPKILPMGTVTRRASESTWLTAPPPSPQRVGSEIKAMVRPPPGYVFVGADVDSEELWIASLVGDSVFGFHGANALGFMMLEGSKADGTDMHSRTAALVGVSRDGAKVINYSRIYGAGARFAATTLQQLNPALSEEEATLLAEDMYKQTKGDRTRKPTIHPLRFWRGGTESFVFNKLETFADQETPQTPVLGAGITQALMRKNLLPREFMPTRINWVVQSSGVDYLHLLLIAMEYLCNRFNISARVALTIHDEVRYLCAEADKYRCAMALQIANVWTRAMFSEQMGIYNLPQSVAWFSSVDIDTVLRKEADMNCITPSHSSPVPHGESLDIAQLLAKGKKAMLDPDLAARREINFERWEYKKRQPVIDAYRNEDTSVYLRAQIVADKDELQAVYEDEGVGPKKKGGKSKKSKDTVVMEKAPGVKGSSGAKQPLGENKPLDVAETTLQPPLFNLVEQELLVPEPVFKESPAVKQSPVVEEGVKQKQAVNKKPVPEVRGPPVAAERQAQPTYKPVGKSEKSKGEIKLELAEREANAAKAASEINKVQETLERVQNLLFQIQNPPPLPPLPRHVLEAQAEGKLPAREKLERLRELLAPHPKPLPLLEIMPKPSPWNHGMPEKLTNAKRKEIRRQQVKIERANRRREKIMQSRATEEHAIRHGLPTKREVIGMKVEIRARKKAVRQRLDNIEQMLVASRDMLSLINTQVKGAPYVELISDPPPRKQMVKRRQLRIKRLQNIVLKRGPLSLTDEEAWELGELREQELEVSRSAKQRKSERAAQLKARRVAKQEKRKKLKAEMAAAKAERKRKKREEEELKGKRKRAATLQLQANTLRKAEARAAKAAQTVNRED